MKKSLVFLSSILLSTTVQAQQRQDIINSIQFNGKDNTIPVSRAFAYAPNIISKCSGSIAGGAQGQFAGISLSGSYKDEFCERAELIKLAIAMGRREDAERLFDKFPMVKELNKEPGQDPCQYPTQECKSEKRLKIK